MKITNFLKSVSTLEIILFILFVFYLVFQIPTPKVLIPFIDSPIGLALIVTITIYLFFYTTPILAILSILVAYELIRRSCSSSSSSMRGRSRIIQNFQEKEPILLNKAENEYIPSESQKDEIIQEMNPVPRATLEEEVIQEMAPISGNNDSEMPVETSYQSIPDRYIDNVARVYY